jgi:hypothetical protein
MPIVCGIEREESVLGEDPVPLEFSHNFFVHLLVIDDAHRIRSAG